MDVSPGMRKNSLGFEGTTFEQRRERELDNILHGMQATVQKMEDEYQFAVPLSNHFRGERVSSLCGSKFGKFVVVM